jgi:hypothetical protein
MMWGLLRRNKFSIKPRLVFDTAGGTTKRRVPHPLRSWQRVGYATVGIEIGGIPPFAKSAKGGAPRGFVALPRTRNAPFHIPRVGYAGGRLTESRMQFDGTTKLHRKSGFGLHQLRNGFNRFSTPASRDPLNPSASPGWRRKMRFD